ncbi:MAG: cytochrome-c peroxidase [Gammaproteobacteria bacterium]
MVANEGVPLPNNLQAFVKDFQAARQLGKALFFEMAAGSDGIQACASCHFVAGADSRSKNQLSPDLLRVKNVRDGKIKGFHNALSDSDFSFQIPPTGLGPNYTLVRGDFPFVKDIGNGANVQEVNGTVSPVSPNSNDVASSQGVLFTRFDGVTPAAQVDSGTPIADPVFNVGGITTRRVEPRNTPTVFNAVFNFTNFWDGRAANRFNGENPFGKADKQARIFKHDDKKKGLVEVPLNLKNASLASQAVGPPLSHFEMSFGNGTDNFRSFAEVGRKLLSKRPLETQEVHPDDSLLASLRDPSGTGLTGTYHDLVTKAFAPNFVSSPTQLVLAANRKRNPGVTDQFAANLGKVQFVSASQGTGPNTFTLSEANFSFFWGVAVMLYEGTLVADETPFDNWMRGDGSFVSGFGEQQLAGLNVFVDKGQCINCHGGPELTNASVRNAQGGNNVIEPMLMGNRRPALYDNGFYNIGVTPTVDDLARGNKDPFGQPLAFARQFAFHLLGIQKINFPIEGEPIRDLVCDPNDSNVDVDPTTCDDRVFGFIDLDFGLGFFPVCKDLNGDTLCGKGDQLLIDRVAVDGSFKTPGLRNVAETAPYFHNGGFASLREVVQFYNRGGNFCRFNRDDLDPDIQGLELTEEEEQNLVAFLISLTDPRGVSRAAPFDAPELRIPNGHPNDQNLVMENGRTGQAQDDLIIIPAVGKNGGALLAPFLSGVDHQVANAVAGGVCSPNFDQP